MLIEIVSWGKERRLSQFVLIEDVPAGWWARVSPQLFIKILQTMAVSKLTSSYAGLGVPQSWNLSLPARGVPQDVEVKEGPLYCHHSCILLLYLSIMNYLC